jgi:D-hexose-6-phosphate mutarotase
MADLRDEDFRQFVCVESGTVRAAATGWKRVVLWGWGGQGKPFVDM